MAILIKPTLELEKSHKPNKCMSFITPTMKLIYSEVGEVEDSQTCAKKGYVRLLMVVRKVYLKSPLYEDRLAKY